jgi:hypothetical protein
MRAILASLAVVLSLAGCTRSAPPSESSGVRGDLSYVGGPLVASPSSPRSEPGYVSAYAGDRPAGTIHVASGQGFSLPLPPGRYTLVPRSGDAHCRERMITVVPNRYETVHLLCDVK